MSARPDTSKPRWSFQDVVDYEYALLLEKDNDSTQNDEEWTKSAGWAPGTLPQKVLGDWLDKRRQTHPERSWPGSDWERAWRILRFAALLVGLISGIGLAIALLRYDGTRPVNVAWFLGIVVIPQLLIAALMVIWAVIPTSVRRYFRPGQSAKPTGWLIWVWARITDRLTKGDQTRFLDLARAVGRHPGLLTTRIAGMPHLLGLAFNIGVIASTLLLVVFSDRAFGWQSTLQVSTRDLHSSIRLIALPWSFWWGEGVGYPSEEQIAGSRIALKDGIGKLDSSALASWWGFLILATATYGLFPRFIILGILNLRERLILRKLPAEHAESALLLHRLQKAAILFTGNSDCSGSERSHQNESIPESPVSSKPGKIQGNYLLYTSPDILHEIPPQAILEQVGTGFGISIASIQEWAPGPDTPPPTLPGILLVEAWQPPVDEFIEAMENLAATAKTTHLPCHLLLTGMIADTDAHPLTPPEASDIKWWTRRLSPISNAWFLVHPFPINETPDIHQSR